MTELLESWTEVRWSLPLSEPPIIESAGIGIHGHQGIERYRLPDLWCLHLYQYEASVQTEKIVYPIRPGYVSLFPPNAPLEYRFSKRVKHIYVHFRSAGSLSPEAVALVPAMQDLGDDFARLYERIDTAIKAPNAQDYYLRAKVWDLLCEISRRGQRPSVDQNFHPAVLKAMQRIEERLATQIEIMDLAGFSGVSRSYLAKLFKSATGYTVVEYIRNRRAQRARHLLRHSTLSIKSIAATVGILDLQTFNKIIRREYGQSPRTLRNAVSEMCNSSDCV